MGSLKSFVWITDSTQLPETHKAHQLLIKHSSEFLAELKIWVRDVYTGQPMYCQDASSCNSYGGISYMGMWLSLASPDDLIMVKLCFGDHKYVESMLV